MAGNIKPDAANGIIFNIVHIETTNILSISGLLQEQGISNKYYIYIRQMMMDMVTDFIEEAHMEWRPSFLFLQVRDGPLKASQRVIRRDCGRAGSLFSLMIKGEATQNLKETNHLPQTKWW